jgi:transcriptional regulator with XRE-family HTH domain
MRAKQQQLPTIHEFIGAHIRERRTALGLGQGQVAEQMGVTRQQMLKYESGESSISASGLYEMARTLGVSITYFYEGFDEGATLRPRSPRQRMVLNVTRLLGEIHDERILAAFGGLIRALANR